MPGRRIDEEIRLRLTDEERKICEETIDRPKGTSQKARRARILLQVDADGPALEFVTPHEVAYCSEAS